MSKKTQEGITVSKDQDFSEWYTQITQKCEIVDKRIPNSKGFYGYPDWGSRILSLLEQLYQKELDKTGHLPIRTPTLIPETLLKLEQEHAQGFVPEGWLVTQGRNNKKLNVKKLLRPTGETIIYPLYHYWVRSHQDLPLKRYEVTSSYRAEPDNAIFPLLRSHQFYWIEAHDVQATNEQADQQIKEDMHIFESVTWKELSLPFFLFKRPEWDKFAGADYTCAYDTPLPDKKVLQIGTTHNLGQHFSKPFKIKFIDEKAHEGYTYQTCFGMGISRILGAIIAIHGDNQGLVLPPPIAPVQVIITPILVKGEDKKILAKVKELETKLNESGIRVHSDTSAKTPGWKFNHWEMKGVPIRLEIGPNELKSKKLILVKRTTKEKLTVAESKIVESVKETLDKILKELLAKSKKLISIEEAKSLDDIHKLFKEGSTFIEVPFCNQVKCAEKLKEKNIKVRGIQLFQNKESTVTESEETANNRAKNQKCIICSKAAKQSVILAKQY